MKTKKNQSEICKLKVKKKDLSDLPVFYNFIIYNRFEKGRLPAYHYNAELQCITDHHSLGKPISKI